MTVVEVMAAAAEAGISLSIEKGGLCCEPAPTGKTLAILKEYKSDILEVLAIEALRRADGGMRAFLDSLPPFSQQTDAETLDSAQKSQTVEQIPLEHGWEPPATPAPRQATSIPGVNYLNEMERLKRKGLWRDTPGLEPIEQEALRAGYTRDGSGWHAPELL